jgi:molybdopterin-containing oxidoreductase family membrane subunit
MSGFPEFLRGSVREVTTGTRTYWLWVGFLLAAMAVGAGCYAVQAHQGLIATNMRDDVSWAFYIGNFTFLVGVAAAAVLLVVPAYLYQWKPIKEVVVLGELLAVSALIMCLLFIVAEWGTRSAFYTSFPSWARPTSPARCSPGTRWS